MASAEDVATFRRVLDALTAALPDDPDEVRIRAAEAVLMETGRPPLPYRWTQIKAPQGCNMRSMPGTDKPIVGTVAAKTQVEAGQDENGWTPVRVTGWVATGMLK